MWQSVWPDAECLTLPRESSSWLWAPQSSFDAQPDKVSCRIPLRYNDGNLLLSFLILCCQDANKTCDFHFVGLLLCRMLCSVSKERLPVSFQPSDRALVVQGFKRDEVSYDKLKWNKCLLKYFREFLHQTFAGGPLNERGPCTVPSGRFNEER